MAPVPNRAVAHWVREQSQTELCVTAITQAELQYGVELLPHGRRRRELEMRTGAILSDCFEGRILPFDSDAASVYASIRANREKSGFSVGVEDTMIAGIAISLGATVATRNIGDFEDCGVNVFNPWIYSASD